MRPGEEICVHCGAGCGREPVHHNGNAFCCHGCETVYAILHENKLGKYYEISEMPGIRTDAEVHLDKYAFLENEEVQLNLIRFREGNLAKVVFYIPAIHCASCIWLLENLRKLHKGIKSSLVNFARKEVSITYDEQAISLRSLVELLDSIHYIPDISASIEGLEDKSGYNKQLLYKIGVAGFVFANVMTYSLPHYFHGMAVDGRLNDLFVWLSYLLIFPVIFYSGRDYLLAAWKNTGKGIVSIDLPIAIGIIALFLVTTYDVFVQGTQGYSDSIAGLIFFLLLGKWYQSKTYEALSFDRDYKSYFPIAVTRILGDAEESVLLRNIRQDDEILIRNKELIPADSLLVEGEGYIDYSFVTGESTLVRKKPGEMLYAGGRQTGSLLRIKVVNEVDQSNLTKLWNQDASHIKESNTLTSLTDRISSRFTLTVLALATAGFIGWVAAGDWHKAFYVFASVLIIACPCALALSIPFTFGNTMRIFGNRGFYIKNTDVIERLSQINTLVFDKTGTLTIPNESAVTYVGEPLNEAEQQAVYSLARQSTHPLSTALAGLWAGIAHAAPEHFVEVEGRGVFGRANGREVKYGSYEYVTGKPARAEGSSMIHVTIDDAYKGTFRIVNKYRPGVEDVVKTLGSSYDLFMISGDNEAERENLAAIFSPDHIFFNQSPAGKAEFIRDLQKEGKNVLMTGDGLNDAGALMQSDVALTVANRVYHFSPASDAVLEAGRFALLDRFIRFTATARNIVKISFAISFLYNLIGTSVALAGYMSPVVAAILMPLSSVSVVAFATFVTRLAGRWQLGKA